MRCYLLTICQGSAVDQNTNNVTLFSIIEGLTVNRQTLGKALPFNTQFHWMLEPSELHTDFETRLVRVPIDGPKDGSKDDPGDIFDLCSKDQPRMRIRAQGFRLPHEFGDYLLFAEWRKKGDEEWTRDSSFCPLSVAPTPTPTDEDTEK